MSALSSFFYTIDHAVSAWFYLLRSDVGVTFFRFITDFGSTKAIILFSLILVGYLLYKHRYQQAGIFTLGLITNTLIVYLLKIAVHRPRQLETLLVETDFSFPSGHTAATIFFFGFLIYFATKHILSHFWRGVVRVIGIVFVILIPVSRLYLGAHYLTDILASLIIASTVLYATVKWWEKASSGSHF